MRADGEYQEGCIETGEVTSGFKTEASVGSGYRYCLGGEVMCGRGEGDEELGVEEGGKPTHIILIGMK